MKLFRIEHNDKVVDDDALLAVSRSSTHHRHRRVVPSSQRSRRQRRRRVATSCADAVGPPRDGITCGRLCVTASCAVVPACGVMLSDLASDAKRRFMFGRRSAAAGTTNSGLGMGTVFSLPQSTGGPQPETQTVGWEWGGCFLFPRRLGEVYTAGTTNSDLWNGQMIRSAEI